MAVVEAALDDQRVREKALDVSRSFIVQAPAGSGKTTLLIQRLLSLLLIVPKMPENCLAITFTKKAALEMQTRLIQALQIATSTQATPELISKKTYDLAVAVLERSNKMGWDLLENPNRLKIQTFDSLCSGLVKKMPVLTQFGRLPEIATDPDCLYERAAKDLIYHLDHQNELTDALKILLEQVDNHMPRFITLLKSLLAKREQWLFLIMPLSQSKNPKQQLEKNLNVAFQTDLDQLAKTCSDHLLELLKNLKDLNISIWPAYRVEALADWKKIAQLLLTKTGLYRKSILKKIPELATKQDFQNRLHGIQILPAAHYNAQQWQILDAFLKILPRLVAHLKLTFKQVGKVDFCENALGALQALDQKEGVSDLALSLDHKISHILIDEFQDTSNLQGILLNGLTRGWENTDGRTLFLVGDPMQSIYRFRQANVGLFLKAKQTGFCDLKLEPLTLTVNFRAQPKLIQWSNRLFSKLFPQQIDLSRGAVSFSPSCFQPSNISKDTTQIKHFLYSKGADQAEAFDLAREIKQIKLEKPDLTMAILVRSRSHLKAIIAILRSEQIAYHGVEIEPLAEKEMIRDLVALTRALLNLSDRIAWLAFLRSPLVGLTLFDVHQFIKTDPKAPIFALLQQSRDQVSLSQTAKKQLEFVMLLVEQTLDQLQQEPLSILIQQLWRALGGDHLRTLAQQPLWDAFFDLVETHEQSREIYEVGFLETALQTLFARSDCIDLNPVEVMTIHKAKGLEFDCVFLPGMGKRSKNSDQALLLWRDEMSFQTDHYLLLAAIKNAEDKADPHYDYLKLQDNQASHFELMRLLYVALTRAREAVYLFADLDLDKEQPRKGSFLDLIWSTEQQAFLASLSNTSEQKKFHKKPLETNPALKRLVYTGLSQSEKIQSTSTSTDPTPLKSVDLIEQLNLKALGISVHAYLYAKAMGTTAPGLIEPHGISQDQLSQLKRSFQHAVENIQTCPKAAWILDRAHQLQQAEWALSGLIQDEMHHIVIDRCFLDQSGLFWIVDYKITQKTTVLSAYRQQLAVYKKIIAAKKTARCATN